MFTGLNRASRRSRSGTTALSEASTSTTGRAGEAAAAGDPAAPEAPAPADRSALLQAMREPATSAVRTCAHFITENSTPVLIASLHDAARPHRARPRGG